MQYNRFCVFFAALMFASFVHAQTPDEAAKERERKRTVILGQVVAEIPNLKLAENRSYISAKMGSIVCKSDSERARSLFQSAITELIEAQSIAEADKSRPLYQNELLSGQVTRPQILNTIAPCDAEFALQSLYKTRPALILNALSASSEKNKKISNNNGENLAQNELQLEQNLMRMAADQNPERAVKLLRDSLKKGFTGETLNLLRKLHEKDPQAAAEIGSEIVSALSRASFARQNQPDYQRISVATTLLTEFVREKQPDEKYIKFNDSDMRSLAGKLISFFVDRPQWQGYMSAPSMIQVAEKLAPAMVSALKQTQRTSPRHGYHIEYDPEISELVSGNQPAATLLSAAKNFPLASRRQIYQTAANKMAQEGDFYGATAVIKDNFSDDALEESLNNLNWNHWHHLMNNGRIEEAERVIDQFSESNRNGALIQLAQSVFSRDPEKKSHALSILERVRGRLSAKPANSNEMSQLMQLISVYSTIEPAESFGIFEPLVAGLNELYEASVIVQGFQGGMNVRDGEYLISQGQSFGFYLDFSIFRTFADSDFDRTVKLMDAFSRREMRLALKLQLAESLAN